MLRARRVGWVGLVLLAAGVGARAQAPAPSPEAEAVLGRISADSLRGNLSFLASDLLEGRDTPSRGLDLAAEYIAAQFRKAGIEPAGDEGYFQVARWKVAESDPATFSCVVKVGDKSWTILADRVSLPSPGPFEVGPVAIRKLAEKDLEAAGDSVEGKAVVVEPPGEPRAAGPFFNQLLKLKPALAITLEPTAAAAGLGRGRLIDPEANARGGMRAPQGPKRLAIHDAAAAEAIRQALADGQEATIELKLGAPVERPVALRNVVGKLAGSDPTLKDTYVLLTAHYDHVGIGEPQNGDRIYNGANDDGSGTVSVIEIATALAGLKAKPKRSILFVCFFGEEKGLLGSRYYGRHPIAPLEKTVAQVNLEHMGRTDDTEGARLNAVSVTGYDYSTMVDALILAGKATGIEIQKHPRNSAQFFGASDNQALADLGIPAHSVCTSFIFPDYHQPGDHWDKVDYDNMAKVDRMVALALLGLANDPNEPTWKADLPAVSRYARAREQLKAGGAKPQP
ncbi:MAG: M20/M25/M40 family metallo-hydrolase [Isosphaeraceae bacterium]